jgi:chromosomal replication initiation ATPase DnaA
MIFHEEAIVMHLELHRGAIERLANRGLRNMPKLKRAWKRVASYISITQSCRSTELVKDIVYNPFSQEQAIEIPEK